MKQEILKQVQSERPRGIRDLEYLVSLRSIANLDIIDDRDLKEAAAWVATQLADLGFESRRVLVSDGTEAVLASYTAGPEAPRLLLYAHYDVQPARAEEWATDPWRLTEQNGRLYGRGSADCKGSIVAHLMALRAIKAIHGDFPCSITVVVEGSEEQGTGALEAYVNQYPAEFDSDIVIIADVGNVAVGVPTFTTVLRGMLDIRVEVSTASSELHAGSFGGPAPDALAALVELLSSFRDDAGNSVIRGVPSEGVWSGASYDEEAFRADAGILPGVERLGSGSAADHLWARPAVTVTGIDAPDTLTASASIQPTASARLNVRIPPGMDPSDVYPAVLAHVQEATPWGARVNVELRGSGRPYLGDPDNRFYELFSECMEDAFSGSLQTSGQGGSIPLTSALADAAPDSAMFLIGVADPACRMHAADESVDPGEIERIALAEALLISRLAGGAR